MTHVFRESFKAFNYRAITPDVAAKELERIHQDRGTLKPQDVVDEARPKEAPLHPAFEWNDFIAGEQYRNIQARSLIKVVHVERSDETEPVYINVNRQESAYEPAVKVVNTPELFEAAFSQNLVFLVQFNQGDGTGDGGVFEQGDHVAGHGGQGRAESLRQDDAVEGEVG